MADRSAPFGSSAVRGDSAGGNSAASPADSPYIVEVDQSNFQAIVQGSINTPTIPTRTPTGAAPASAHLAVEQAVVDASGKLILAKINTDEAGARAHAEDNEPPLRVWALAERSWTSSWGPSLPVIRASLTTCSRSAPALRSTWRRSL